MLGSLIGLMAAMSFAPPAIPGSAPATIFSQSLPVQAAMVSPRRLTVVRTPRRKDPDNLGVVVTGNSAFVADVASGGVLFAKAPHDVHSIASLTKLMTALVLLDTDKGLDGELTFQASDFDNQSKPVFAVGDTVTRREAFTALLVGSVNASGEALVRTSGLSREQFILRMNQKAKDLHLPSFTFVDVTGLETGNRGNAADVAALTTIALRQDEIRKAANLPEVVVTPRGGKPLGIKSTNLLLDSFLYKNPYKIIGAKTGSLPDAGYNLAQVTRDAKGHEVVAVLLDSDNHFSRYRDVKIMTAWAFDSFEWLNQ